MKQKTSLKLRNLLIFITLVVFIFWIAGEVQRPEKELPVDTEATKTDESDVLDYGFIQHMQSYRPDGAIKRLIFVLSEEESWSANLAPVIIPLPQQDNMVIWIDNREFLKQLNEQKTECTNVGIHLQNLIASVKQNEELPSPIPVILIGHMSGASLAYAGLLQSNTKTFSAYLSLGDCPRLEYSNPLCRTERLKKTLEQGAQKFASAGSILTLWLKSERNKEGMCKPEEADTFVKQILGTDVIHIETGDRETLIEVLSTLVEKTNISNKKKPLLKTREGN